MHTLHLPRELPAKKQIVLLRNIKNDLKSHRLPLQYKADRLKMKYLAVNM